MRSALVKALLPQFRLPRRGYGTNQTYLPQPCELNPLRHSDIQVSVKKYRKSGHTWD